MKKPIQILRFALIGAFIALLNFGCASTSSNGGGLTLDQTYQQVEDAMLTFRNASTAGDVPRAQNKAIESAYKEYKAAYDAALAQAGSNKKATAPDNVKAAAESVVAKVSAIP